MGTLLPTQGLFRHILQNIEASFHSSDMMPPGQPPFSFSLRVNPNPTSKSTRTYNHYFSCSISFAILFYHFASFLSHGFLDISYSSYHKHVAEHDHIAIVMLLLRSWIRYQIMNHYYSDESSLPASRFSPKPSSKIHEALSNSLCLGLDIFSSGRRGPQLTVTKNKHYSTTFGTTRHSIKA